MTAEFQGASLQSPVHEPDGCRAERGRDLSPHCAPSVASKREQVPSKFAALLIRLRDMVVEMGESLDKPLLDQLRVPEDHGRPEQEVRATVRVSLESFVLLMKHLVEGFSPEAHR